MSGRRPTNGDARDLREGGAWSPLQRAKNDAIFAAAAVAIAAASRLPSRWLAAAGRALGRFAFAVLGPARRRAIAEVARATGDDGAIAIARGSFVTLGEELGLAIASLGGAAPPLLPIPAASRAVLEAAIGEGRGVVFASAHLAPWDRVAEAVAAAFPSFRAVARESYDPRFTALVERARLARGVACIHRGRPDAAKEMVRLLRGGGVLGIPMDLKTRVPSTQVPFLGSPAPTPTGPARLALRTGAAVVVGTVAAGDGGGLVVSVTRIPTPTRGEAEDPVADLLLRINDELSRRILALPERWPWAHERR